MVLDIEGPECSDLGSDIDPDKATPIVSRMDFLARESNSAVKLLEVVSWVNLATYSVRGGVMSDSFKNVSFMFYDFYSIRLPFNLF